MDAVGSFWGIAALFSVIGLILMTGLIAVIAMVLLLWKRRVQEIAAVTFAAGLMAGGRMLPMPSHMDGIVVALGRQDPGSYADVSKWLRKRSADEKGPQDAPPELLTRFPGIAEVFDPFPNPKLPPAIRYEIDPGYVTVWTGGRSEVTGGSVFMTDPTSFRRCRTLLIGEICNRRVRSYMPI